MGIVLGNRGFGSSHFVAGQAFQGGWDVCISDVSVAGGEEFRDIRTEFYSMGQSNEPRRQSLVSCCW